MEGALMSLKNKETPKKPRAPTSAWQKSQKHQQHCFSTMLQPAPGESGHTQTRCVYELNQSLLERGTAGQGTQAVQATTRRFYQFSF